MKFGIVVSENPKARKIAAEVSAYLVAEKHEVVEKGFTGADFILTLGGDGTLLHTACKYADLEVPYVGINVGTLGFLTAEEGEDWKKAVDKLIAGEFVISQRMTIEADAGDRHLRAVNEIVVRGLYRVISLTVGVTNRDFLDIAGDGVIVSSQTGSTGYSLSAGGPIVDPELNCFLLTPINPTGLPVPTVVLDPNDEIEIRVKKGVDIGLIADGQEHTRLEVGDIVRVKRGSMNVKFVYFGEHQFVDSLNAKFGLANRLSKSG